jgi:hypothetical protein
VIFTKADGTWKPEVLLTKTDVMRKPSLACGPVTYILRLSFPLLDRTTTKYQNPKDITVITVTT